MRDICYRKYNASKIFLFNIYPQWKKSEKTSLHCSGQKLAEKATHFREGIHFTYLLIIYLYVKQ